MPYHQHHIFYYLLLDRIDLALVDPQAYQTALRQHATGLLRADRGALCSAYSPDPHTRFEESSGLQPQGARRSFASAFPLALLGKGNFA